MMDNMIKESVATLFCHAIKLDDKDKAKDKTIITEEQIYNDLQLKSAVDILKALIINKK